MGPLLEKAEEGKAEGKVVEDVYLLLRRERGHTGKGVRALKKLTS